MLRGSRGESPTDAAEEATMRRVQAIVIGAGQAGLAMSHCLGRLGIDHVVLERGRLAERWRNPQRMRLG